MTDPTTQPFRWLMLFGASLVYASFGGLMAAMSVLVKPISDTLSLSPFQMGTVLGAWQFVYLFAAIPAGAVLDRVGLRPSLAVAGTVITLSAAMRVYADSYAALLLAVCLFGLGGPLISVGAPKLVSRWFAGAERGLAMGVFMSSTAVGALLATIGTNSVIMPLAGGDWRGAFLIYSWVMLSVTVAWVLIASRPRSALGDTAGAATRPWLDTGVLRSLLANPEVRLTMLMAVTMFFFVHSLNAWLPEILRGKGLSLVDASYWSGLPVLIAIGATLIITRLAVPARRTVILIGVTLLAMTSALLLETRPVALLAGSLLGLGIARSCLVPVALLVLMDAEPGDGSAVGTASGLFFAAGQIGGMLGPVLCGLAIDATGDYGSPLHMMAAAMVVLMLLLVRLVWLRRPVAGSGPA
jgi:cyanate permease